MGVVDHCLDKGERPAGRVPGEHHDMPVSDRRQIDVLPIGRDDDVARRPHVVAAADPGPPGRLDRAVGVEVGQLATGEVAAERGDRVALRVGAVEARAIGGLGGRHGVAGGERTKALDEAELVALGRGRGSGRQREGEPNRARRHELPCPPAAPEDPCDRHVPAKHHP